MGLLPEIASHVLKLREYLKKNSIAPQKEFTKLQEVNGKFVYTYQCQFETKAEADNFVLFCKVIQSGMLDIKKQ